MVRRRRLAPESQSPGAAQVLYEDDTAAPSIEDTVPDIKPQVHLFEIAVKGKSHSENACPKKRKPTTLT